VSAEGSFDAPLDMDRLEVMLRALGEVRSMDGVIFVPQAGGGSLQVYATGTVVVRAKDEAAARQIMERAEKAIRKAMLCTGCGVCVGACPTNAITKESQKAVIGESCTGCGECIDICPIVKYRRSDP
jgi:phosphoadenosine phosphosulfate reductase